MLDLISYESANMLDSLFMEKLRGCEEDENVDLSCIQRFVIPLISDLKVVAEGVELLQKNTKCSAIRIGSRIILHGHNFTQRGIEMPIINKQFYGKPYKFVYAAGKASGAFNSHDLFFYYLIFITGTFNASQYFHCITKTDLHSGETIVWNEGNYFYPGGRNF